jgi:tetratricopeptide (TPR) repeat protein
MDLVKGVPITKYCDEHHLTPRQRLELFIPVCQAVQHAHQKGIIHRDIKPSNVLVALYDGRPVPKVIDFGVAKATGQPLTENTLVTGFGAIVGTLEYMSPEQAEINQLDIDTRSDIYSLGVLLYELLTGSPPFSRKDLEKAGMLEMLRVIREQEPSKPSTKLSKLSSPHAPRAEGGTRSVPTTLASVAANRGTEPAKLTKLVRGELDWIVMKALEKDRNRRYETANGFAMDVQRYLADDLVQACPPSVGYRVRKFVRRHKPQLAAAGLLLLASLAGLGFVLWHNQELDAKNHELDAKNTELVAVVASEKQAKQTAEQREAETKAVLEFVENKVFAAARPEGQNGGMGHDVTLRMAIEAALPFVEKSFSTKPLIEGRLRETLGMSFLYLGEGRKAEEQFEKVRAIYAKHLGPDHPATLVAMGNLAIAYLDAGRTQEAIKLHEETLQLQKAKLGPEHPATLGSMVNLASSNHQLGRTNDSIKLLEQALQVMKAKLPDHEFTFKCMSQLAWFYRGAGRTQEALKLSEETLQLMKAKLGPEHPDTLVSMSNLATCYSDLGRHGEGLKLHEETLQLQKAKLGPEHPSTLWSKTKLATAYDRLDRHDEALKLNEETLQLQKVKLGRDHPATLQSMNNLAASYLQLGRHAEGLKLTEEALAIQKAKLGPDHPLTLVSMMNLVISYVGTGSYAKAVALGEEVLPLLKRKFGPNHRGTLGAMTNLAAAYDLVGRYADAMQLQEEALRLKQAHLRPEDPFTLTALENLTWLLANVPDTELRNYARAVELATKQTQLAPDKPESWGCLGAARYRLGEHKQAIADLEKAVSMLKLDTLSDTAAAASNAYFLAMARWELGDKAKAREWFAKAEEWKQKAGEHKPWVERARAEAAELLGVGEKK